MGCRSRTTTRPSSRTWVDLDGITTGAMRSCDGVHAAVAAGHAPYDGSHESWLRILADLLAGQA